MVRFSDFGLDLRILKAIDELGWVSPTPIQQKILHYSREGRNIIACACTGSGKTGAFLLPIIQSVLNSDSPEHITSLILSPTREISHQTLKFLHQLTKFLPSVKSVDISDPSSPAALLSRYKPNVVISTCSRLLHLMKHDNIKISDSLRILVVDEADLSLSLSDRRKEIDKLMSLLPPRQTLLMSATLSLTPFSLPGLSNPVTLNLTRSYLPPQSLLTQHVLKCKYNEKFQVLVALLRLSIINERLLIFVNSVNKCYKLKLFLEQFAIRSCVLNSEMPLSCRIHVIEQFNRRVYDIVIASDSKCDRRDYSTARGVDFQKVGYVINFDFPPSYVSYVHRIGRTARMGQKGVGLSLVSPGEEALVEEVVGEMNRLRSGDGVVPYPFDMEEIRGFDYRVEGGLRAITKTAVKEARLEEIKREMLNCERIKSRMGGEVVQQLRHDHLSKCRMSMNVKTIPDYILPLDYKDKELKTPIFSKKKRRRKGRPHVKSNKTNVLKMLRVNK